MSNLADLNFNANDVAPNDFGVIPPGDYEAVIVNSSMHQTKAGDGEYLKLELQIINGTYQNRKLFENLNLKNKNEQAVTIAKGTLSAICRAINVLTPRDSSELHNKPMRITVGVRNENGEQRNHVKSYKPRQAGPAFNQQPAQQSYQQPVQNKPW